MPVILSQNITALSPKCMWLGGGDIDLKISKKEYILKTNYIHTIMKNNL